MPVLWVNSQEEKNDIKNDFLLQLILLNESTVVLVNDAKSLLDIIGRLGSETNLGEEGLVVEAVRGCRLR